MGESAAGEAVAADALGGGSVKLHDQTDEHEPPLWVLLVAILVGASVVGFIAWAAAVSG